MVRAIILASALMIGSAALAQDAAPPADTPPQDNSASYPPCSATVQDHCIQGQHRGSTHKAARHTRHTTHKAR